MGGSGSGRKGHQNLGKNAVAVRPIGNLEIKPIPLGNLAGDGESQAGAFDIERRGAIETVEDARQRMLGNAYSGVAYLDSRARGRPLDRHFDIAAARRVTDRVLDEVCEEEPDFRIGCFDADAVLPRQGEID